MGSQVRDSLSGQAWLLGAWSKEGHVSGFGQQRAGLMHEGGRDRTRWPDLPDAFVTSRSTGAREWKPCGCVS